MEIDKEFGTNITCHSYLAL